MTDTNRSDYSPLPTRAVKDIERIIEKLSSKIDNIASSQESFQGLVGEVHRLLGELKGDLESIRSDYLDRLKHQLNELQTHIKRIRTRINEVRDAVSTAHNELKSSILEAQKLIVGLNQGLNEITLKIQTLINDISTLSEDFANRLRGINQQIGEVSRVLHTLVSKMDSILNSIDKVKQDLLANIQRFSPPIILLEHNQGKGDRQIPSNPAKLTFDKAYKIIYWSPANISKISLKIDPEELDNMIIHEGKNDIAVWKKPGIYIIKFRTNQISLTSWLKYLFTAIRGFITINYTDDKNNENCDVIIPVELKTRSIKPILIGLIPILIGLIEPITKILTVLGMGATTLILSIALIVTGATWIGLTRKHT